MPVYNGEKTLPLAVASLLHQTYPSWKCYIVNDGSTDGTKAYLDTLDDKRFSIIHFKKNKGRPFARNKALERCCQYQFVAFLDADDFYHPDKLMQQVTFLERHENVDLVSCGMGSFSDTDGLQRVRGISSIAISKYYYRNELNVPRAACMIRGKKIGKLLFNPKLLMAQDSDFFTRYAHGRYYGTINSILYYYSEFDSVTKEKVMKTHYYNTTRYIFSFPEYPLSSVLQLFKAMTKWGYFVVRSSIYKFEVLLNERGQLPENSQREDYFQLRKLLGF